MFRMTAWARLGLDNRKMLSFCFACGASAGAAVYATTRSVMPGDSLLLAALISAVGFYLASSLPNRIDNSSALAQSREAAPLAVLGSTALEATKSRAKTILLLESSEGSLSAALRVAKRQILLGNPAQAAVSMTNSLSSVSVREVLQSIASPAHPLIVEEGEEVRAISRTSQLGDETKSPVFIAASFFTPLMLFLYALMSHVVDAVGLTELVILQIIILDVAFYFSSGNRLEK